jgi:flagellar hook-associated protein 3 FlgL
MPSINTISSFQKNFDLRSQVAKQGADMNDATIELSTGLKSDVYGEARGASGESLNLRAHLKANEAFLQASGLLSGRMEAMEDSLAATRSEAGDFMNFMLSGSIAETNRSVLQAEAKQTLEQMVNKLNGTYAGASLFAGLATDVRPMTLNADWSVTYNGDTTGNLSARIDDETTMEFGVRADDPGFTDVFDALTLVASTNLDLLSDAAFATLRDTVAAGVSSGLEKLTVKEADLGSNRGVLERTVDRQTSLRNLLNDSILGIEGVDANEAAIRLTSVQGQLEATYAITARINSMSFLNYL